jgi:predicted nucleic acid-binding protein
MAIEETEVAGRRRLVLDANILLRGILGTKVLSLLETYEDTVVFYSPDICFDDAREYIPDLATRRGFDPSAGLRVLDQLTNIVKMVDRTLYEEREESARNRIALRDPADWPIVATSLLLDCPIWTEDRDFFGAGVATWTSQTVEFYLRGW